MPTKLANSLKYRHVVEVTTSNSFPVDMLRYDSCFPLTETDALVIQLSLNPMVYEYKEYRVRVARYYDTKFIRWSEDRWNSFHCTLEEVDEYSPRI